MESVTSLFTKTVVDDTLGSEVSSDDFGTNGALSEAGKPGSGGFGLDRIFSGKGGSQQIPFVGPVVSVFQAFNDERDARNSAARLEFNANAEEQIGKAQTVSALRQLNDVQAKNVTIAFAGGGNLAGSRGRAIQDNNRDAQLGFDLIKTNAEIKAADLRQKAKVIRKVARFDRNAAIGKSLFRFVSSI